MKKLYSSELGNLYLRLLDQSFAFNFHHLGSAFSTLPIIYDIYKEKESKDAFILSCGHAAAALYVVLEKEFGADSSELFSIMGEHPHRDKKWRIDCSTGSLGMGISVAVGMALADPNQRVYCIVSDGECSEGIFWESIRFAKAVNLTNLIIHVNMNGWSGYDKVDTSKLSSDITSVNNRVIINATNNYPFENFGLSSHYVNLDKKLYLELKMRICEDFL